MSDFDQPLEVCFWDELEDEKCPCDTYVNATIVYVRIAAPPPETNAE